MWFNPLGGPDLMNMRLGEDGSNLRAADGGTACSENAGPDGLLLDVAGSDIYGDTSEHFEKIAWPGRHYDLVWDWRKDADDSGRRARRDWSSRRAAPSTASSRW